MALSTPLPLLQDQPVTTGPPPFSRPGVLDAGWIKTLALEAGADDVGVAEISLPELDEQREDIRAVFPRAKSLLSFVVCMNREPIRSPARSIANLEFHRTGNEVN